MEKKQIKFYVKGMMCQHCKTHVENALNSLGIEDIQINLDTKEVVVLTDLSKEEIFNAIINAGYEPSDN